MYTHNKGEDLLFLCAEVMDYTMATIKALVRGYDVRIHVVCWSKKKLTPYQMEKVAGVTFSDRSVYGAKSLLELIRELRPVAAYVAGWADSGYLSALREYRREGGIVVVCGLDNKRRPGIRQFLGKVKFALSYRFLFDYLWVPGPRQYNFAAYLGYPSHRIKQALLTADTEKFNYGWLPTKRFVFVGRMETIKGLDSLVESFLSIDQVGKNSLWHLDLYGSGTLMDGIRQAEHGNITVHGFVQPMELREELNKGGVFVLPSRGEPYGVVIHEAAATGYPMLLSNVCGAADNFLVDGYNGFLFDPNSSEQLTSYLRRFIAMDSSELTTFSKRSHKLSMRINSFISAAEFMSTVSK
jgi:glycosyltransferase involved in cell wall biosynthesis